MSKRKTGPRSCKVHKNVTFIAGEKNVCIKTKDPDSCFENNRIDSLKDAQVRKLRNWLNWYLDNK